jgi:surface carbohydrate biosynthesis protein (TIGR04326 family)
MICAGREANQDFPIIGVQHGPISNRKLMYKHHENDIASNGDFRSDTIPLPDKTITEGQQTKEVLTSGNIPQNQIQIGGAPRLAGLPRIGNQNENCHKEILVILGQHDGEEILNFLKNSPVDGSQRHFKIKPHPRSKFDERSARKFSEKNLSESYDVTAEPVSESLKSANMVIVTYSSVGLEAATIGLPVVCLQLSRSINTSPLMDYVDGLENVFVVNNPSELAETVLKTAGKHIEPKYPPNDFFERIGRDSEILWAKLISSELQEVASG